MEFRRVLFRSLLYRISHEKTKELAILNLQRKQARTMQPCNEGETARTATWSPDGHHIAIICNGKSPIDLEAAKSEKPKPGCGTTADEADKAETPLGSMVIIATRTRF